VGNGADRKRRETKKDIFWVHRSTKLVFRRKGKFRAPTQGGRGKGDPRESSKTPEQNLRPPGGEDGVQKQAKKNRIGHATKGKGGPPQKGLLAKKKQEKKGTYAKAKTSKNNITTASLP